MQDALLKAVSVINEVCGLFLEIETKNYFKNKRTRTKFRIKRKFNNKEISTKWMSKSETEQFLLTLSKEYNDGISASSK